MKNFNKIDIYFPIAGQGARFGYKFKPFLKVGQNTFIEESVKPFLKWRNKINCFYFIFLNEQDVKFNVTDNLKILFKNIRYKNIILKAPTSGPVETIYQALKKNIKSINPSIFCDCDHSINIDNFFSDITLTNCNVSFPVWKISKKNFQSWSIVSIKNKKVIDIEEKKLPKKNYKFFGVIGCYYFKNPEIILKKKKFTYISEIIKYVIKNNEEVKYYIPSKVSFFGDPDRLKDEEIKRGIYKSSIFLDIDGTLIAHQNKPNYKKKPIILDGTEKKIHQWMEKGYYIILCTARSPKNRDKLEKLLKNNNISYNDLLMGLPSGPRTIINDRKPYNILKPQSYHIEIDRNEGINNIELISDEITTIKQFKGGSASSTYLVEDFEKKFVRKIVSKKNNIRSGMLKLKSQFNLMKKFNNKDKSFTPFIYSEGEDGVNYYYDMEFLEGFKKLSEISSNHKVIYLTDLFKKIYNNLYKHKIQKLKNNWLEEHINEKIITKIVSFDNDKIDQIIKNENLIINGQNTISINNIFESKELRKKIIDYFNPNFFSMVHGDLTYENILVSKNYDEIRVIDTDSNESLSAIELDLGKMFQSSYLKYEEWEKNKDNLFKYKNLDSIKLNFVNLKKSPDHNKIEKFFSQVIGDYYKNIYKTGIFYMSLHLIRMIPYKKQYSLNSAIYAALLARYFLNKSIF